MSGRLHLNRTQELVLGFSCGRVGRFGGDSGSSCRDLRSGSAHSPRRRARTPGGGLLVPLSAFILLPASGGRQVLALDVLANPRRLPYRRGLASAGVYSAAQWCGSRCFPCFVGLLQALVSMVQVAIGLAMLRVTRGLEFGVTSKKVGAVRYDLTKPPTKLAMVTRSSFSPI